MTALEFLLSQKKVHVKSPYIKEQDRIKLKKSVLNSLYSNVPAAIVHHKLNNETKYDSLRHDTSDRSNHH